MLLRLILVAAIAVASSEAAANCFTSFNVSRSKTVPDLTVVDPVNSQFSGRNCGSLELEREALFVDQLANISEQTFSSIEAWTATRDRLVDEIETTRQRLAQARRDGADAQTWNTIKTLSINVTGAAFTIMGCPTSWTGIGALACAGGITMTVVGTYDSLTADGFMDAAEAVDTQLTGLQALLQQQNEIGQSVLDARGQAYLKRFERMCRIVQYHCL